MNILNECLVCELSFGSRSICLVRIYRTASLSSNVYENFLLIFEQLLTYLNSIKPHALPVTGDFNDLLVGRLIILKQSRGRDLN